MRSSRPSGITHTLAAEAVDAPQLMSDVFCALSSREGEAIVTGCTIDVQQCHWRCNQGDVIIISRLQDRAADVSHQYPPAPHAVATHCIPATALQHFTYSRMPCLPSMLQSLLPVSALDRHPTRRKTPQVRALFIEFEKMQSRRCNGSSGEHSAAERSASRGDLLHEIKTKKRKKKQ